MSDVPSPPRPIEAAIGRSIDIVGSLGLLLFLAPLLLVIIGAIAITDPGPMLFGHKRLGRGGRTFRCLKFRSMVVDAETRLNALLAVDPAVRQEWERDHKLRADPRITKVGAFLRRSSLDELPQLLNILLGEMSLVGPRPIVQAEVERYGRYFPLYCKVRPGLTGLWQISGRSDTSYRRRVALDIAYARSKSLRLDMKILFMTIPSVLLARGSY